jgi:hypothetical protein
VFFLICKYDVQLLSNGFSNALTIPGLLCGIFPVPQFHNRAEIFQFPRGTVTIFDEPWEVAVWGRNPNFKKEKNRP